VYLSNYLSAHADYQLTTQERRIANLHVGECRACQCRLFEERYLKALVRRTLLIARTPIEVEMRIRAALHEPVDRTDQPLKSFR
jgi:hypothetical protein